MGELDGTHTPTPATASAASHSEMSSRPKRAREAETDALRNAANGAAPAAARGSKDEFDAVEYVVVEFAGAASSATAEAQLAAGTAVCLQNLETTHPTLRLANGDAFVGAYEDTVGCCLLFDQERAAGPQAAGDAPAANRVPGVRYRGYTEKKLIFREQHAKAGRAKGAPAKETAGALAAGATPSAPPPALVSFDRGGRD